MIMQWVARAEPLLKNGPPEYVTHYEALGATTQEILMVFDHAQQTKDEDTKDLILRLLDRLIKVGELDVAGMAGVHERRIFDTLLRENRSETYPRFKRLAIEIINNRRVSRSVRMTGIFEYPWWFIERLLSAIPHAIFSFYVADGKMTDYALTLSNHDPQWFVRDEAEIRELVAEWADKNLPVFTNIVLDPYSESPETQTGLRSLAYATKYGIVANRYAPAHGWYSLEAPL